jgi:hypothetical protein
VPGSDKAPDPNNPVYLQQVANALNAINSNQGTHSRYRNDLALFSKFDVQAGTNDRLYLSLNLNRFNSPNGEITLTPLLFTEPARWQIALFVTTTPARDGRTLSAAIC